MSQLIYFVYCTCYICTGLVYNFIVFYPQGILLAIILLLLAFINIHIYAIHLNHLLYQILYYMNFFEKILILFNTLKYTYSIIFIFLSLLSSASYQWSSYWLIFRLKKFLFYLFWLGLILQLVRCLWLQQLKF